MEGGCLAGSVRAQKADRLATCEPNRDIPDNALTLETFSDAAGNETHAWIYQARALGLVRHGWKVCGLHERRLSYIRAPTVWQRLIFVIAAGSVGNQHATDPLGRTV